MIEKGKIYLVKKSFELMEDTIYAPVVIPTCNRYGHLKECVESLAQCTHAEKTELYISVDFPPNEQYVEGWKKVKKYVQEITGFKKTRIFFQEKNMGSSPNSHFIIDKAFEEYEYLVFAEDDNIFAPAFLDYMNKMLLFFENDPKVQSVSGFSYLHHHYSSPLYKSPEFMPYGTGRWKKKWYDWFKIDPVKLYEDFSRKIWKVAYLYLVNKWVFCAYVASLGKENIVIDTHDGTQTLLNYVLGYHVVYPAKTLVKNKGFDGSGLRCRKNIIPDINGIELSEDTLFVCDNLKHIPVSYRRSFPLPEWVIKSSKFRVDPLTYILYWIMGRERYMSWKKNKQE